MIEILTRDYGSIYNYCFGDCHFIDHLFHHIQKAIKSFDHSSPFREIQLPVCLEIQEICK